MPDSDREANRILRPRGALCARRRQHGRGRRPHGRRAPVRLEGRGRIERGGAGPGARRPQGADHEGGAAARHHPGPAAARIRGRTAEAPDPRRRRWAAAFVQAAHAGGARAGLAGPLRLLRSQAGRRGLARPGPPRDCQGRLAARLQAAISRHAVGRRGGPAASWSSPSPSIAAWTRPSTPARSPRRSASGCARNSTTRARPSTSRSTPPCSTTCARCGCRRRGRTSRPVGC